MQATFTRPSIEESPLALLESIGALVDGPAAVSEVCTRFLSGLQSTWLADAAGLFVWEERSGRVTEQTEGRSGLSDRPGVERLALEALERGTAVLGARTGPSGYRDRPRRPVLAGASRESGDLAAVPVIVGGSPWGSLVIARDGEKGTFGSVDLSVAAVLCRQLALALDRAMAREALDRECADGDGLRGQLEIYARDVRATFVAEKRRAEQLDLTLQELEQTYLATVRGLAVAVETKDAYTAGHLVRVTAYGLAMMKLIAPALTPDPQFEYGFLLHDVGKLGVPDNVLGKPGALEDDEWRIMRQHPAIGARILENIPFLAEARKIVYLHHERWDGRGYPLGARGEEIPLGARVFPLADTFDAMTSDRPYRPAMSVDQAREEIKRGSGTQFWPVAVEAFLSLGPNVLDPTSPGG